MPFDPQAPARSWRSTLLAQLLDIAPPRCLHCGQCGSLPEWLCSQCLAEVSGNLGACPRCGLPGGTGGCESCSTNPPAFRQTVAPLTYSPVVRTLIHRWKFKGHTGLTPYLTGLAGVSSYARTAPDAIIPVPPHWRRRLSRGFDQTWLLANDIARRHPAQPVVKAGLRRHRRTDQQRQLGSEARIRNMAGAFVATENMLGRHVALIDDVMTTGATVNACAQALLAAGARQVDVWCLVRVASPAEGV